MIRAAWLLGRGRSPENSGFQRHPAASISNISVPVPVDSTSQLCNITQVRMGWNSNVWMPWNWIHMETRALQSAMDNSHLTAQHPPRVQVPYTPWPQLLNLSPTQALHLPKSLAVFHFPLPEHAVNTACPVFHRELHENWLHRGKILLWVIRQNKNQTKPIQGKPAMEKRFLRWQSSQTKGLSENREKPLLTDTVCQKEWNPGRILKTRGKCGYFHYTEILCDFIITKVV